MKNLVNSRPEMALFSAFSSRRLRWNMGKNIDIAVRNLSHSSAQISLDLLFVSDLGLTDQLVRPSKITSCAFIQF